MASHETNQAVTEALEDYYLSCGVNPHPEVADYSSDRPQTGTALKPGEVVTLPAPGEASSPA